MARRLSVTSLVGLALLASLVGIAVEALPQGKNIWKQPPPNQNPGQWVPSSQNPMPSVSPSRYQYGANENQPQPVMAVYPQPPSVSRNPGSSRWNQGHASGSTIPSNYPKPPTPAKQPNPQSSVTMMHDSQTFGEPKIPQNLKLPKTETPRKTPIPQTANDQTVRNPQVTLGQTPLPPPADRCEVPDSVRVPCGPPGINSEQCDALSCCHDGRGCYFGKAVTVQCTKDGQFIVVVAKDATLPKLDTDTVSLLGTGTSCSCVDSNSAFSIYQFPVTACGTLVMESSGAIVYENSMSSLFEVDSGPRGAITRDTVYELMFQCRYVGQSVEVLVVEVQKSNNPLVPVADMGILRVGMRLGNGKCVSKGCDELAVAYSSYYTEADYPVGFVLRDPVYVEVGILDQKNPDYVLTLDRCWATTCADAHSLPQWDIIVNGCPNFQDNYRTSLVPVPRTVDLYSHYRRFVFQMFAFVDQGVKLNKQELYIHCSTSVCVPSFNRSCEPTCVARQRRNVPEADQKGGERKMVASSGLLTMSAAAEE